MEPKTELTQTSAAPQTPPTPPDYKALYEEAALKAKRLDELEPQYKNLQRDLNKARQAQPAYVTRDDLTASEDRIAQMLEAVRGSDEDDEEKPKRKPTPSEILKQHREATKPATFDTSKLDEMVQVKTFEALLDLKGIEASDPAVMEALEYAKANNLSVGKTVQRIEKSVEKRAKEAEVKEAATREALKQQIAKEQGWTGKDGGPNASADDVTLEDIRKHANDRNWTLANADKIEAAYKKGKFFGR